MNTKLDNGCSDGKWSFNGNPIVYHVITDRFLDSDPHRQFAFGRERGNSSAPGAFQGGTFAGVTRKLQEGWFKRLGINALLISPPYEQIHGWVPGGASAFRHYGYHGYYAADFTVPDPNFGSYDDLRTLVECAHAQGIRVIFDVVMNHPGYADMGTLADFGIDVLKSGWERASIHNYHEHIDYCSDGFMRWWGPGWVRCGLPGHLPGGSDELTMQLAELPDFRTESSAEVALPTFLLEKADSRVRPILGASVRTYLIEWLTSWVRELGVDGFRCDSARHVEFGSWSNLKRAATKALCGWKLENPEKKIDDAPFWMMGEVFDHGPERSAYFDHGFDNVINFQFQHLIGDCACLDDIYYSYSECLTSGSHQFTSYISSHDTHLFPRHELFRAATALMLAPGAVMLFYGDETARLAWTGPEGDWVQGTRSTMNWDCVDFELLAHWQKLGQFRLRHPALARGRHTRIDDYPYAFLRQDELSGDIVLVVLDAPAGSKLRVPAAFHGMAHLRDAYGGDTLPIVDSHIEFTEHRAVVLIENC